MPREVILYYSPEGGGAKVKAALAPMGVPVRDIGPGQLDRTVGELAGPAAKARAEACQRETAHIKESVMVLCGFTEERLDLLLRTLRRAGAGSGVLKAVLTPHNRGWTFSHLCGELVREHRLMTGGGEAGGPW